MKFAEGSRLEEIGENCFYKSGLEEITLPRTWRRIGHETFRDCDSLHRIYVEDGCETDLHWAEVPDSAQVGPLLDTMANGVSIWALRNCKQVAIPEGTERVGNSWFYGCDVESVEVPASVKYIDANAFYKCKSLKRVVFAKGSRLEIIGSVCFHGSGIEEATLPSTVGQVGDAAFSECRSLRTIYIKDGCEASLVNVGVPASVCFIFFTAALVGGVRV